MIRIHDDAGRFVNTFHGHTEKALRIALDLDGASSLKGLSQEELLDLMVATSDLVEHLQDAQRRMVSLFLVRSNQASREVVA